MEQLVAQPKSSLPRESSWQSRRAPLIQRKNGGGEQVVKMTSCSGGADADAPLAGPYRQGGDYIAKGGTTAPRGVGPLGGVAM
jgi:hypothetical protein